MQCRSILAEAIFKAALMDAGLQDEILVESASIGPIGSPCLDSRVALVARRLGIALGAFHPRVFDEVNDVVECDMVLTMDRFDFEEVYKEVSVLDAINPGGFYCSRMKLFGDFSLSSPIPSESREAVEVSDPFYGVWDAVETQKNLDETVRLLRIAARGLVHYMQLLRPKRIYSISLQSAVIQSLRCPVIDGSSGGRLSKLNSSTWKPVWKGHGADDGRLFTVRYIGGQRKKIVKKKEGPHENGYWCSIENVEKELCQWMKENECRDRIPMHKELQGTGNWSLSFAITKHGGPTVFAERLSLPTVRKRTKKYGYWSDFNNVKKEIKDWMSKYGEEGVMPKYGELCKTGHKNLARVISKHGGSREFIEKMGLEIQKGGKGFWENGRLETEMKKYCTTNDNGDVFLPTRETLISQGRADLYGAMQSFGGAQKLAQKMGILTRKRSFRSFQDVMVDIKSVATIMRSEARMPTKLELERVGRGDLLREIRYYGGFKKFASKAGWVYMCRGHEDMLGAQIDRRLAFSFLVWQCKIAGDSDLFDVE